MNAYAEHNFLHLMARGRPHRREDAERAAALRNLSGGRGGPPFGGGRGRRRRGDVRAALLRLIAEEPRNGYQLMQEIEERSGGRWRPSPGSVYPTLQQLEDEGLIRPIEQDGTKLFDLTDAGREHLGSSETSAAPWDSDDDPESLSDIKPQMKKLQIATMMVLRGGNDDQIARAARALSDARRAIYGILAEDTDD